MATCLAYGEARPGNNEGQVSLVLVPTSAFISSISTPFATTAMSNETQLDGASRRILLVTADHSVRETSLSVLRAAGYCPDGEADTDEAWAALCRQGYELLVIDHKVPGGSGLRLVLRMSQAHLTLPVVLVIDSPLAFDPRTHHRLRGLTILTKPITAERLVECVFLTLQGASATRPMASRLPLIETGAHAQQRVTRAGAQGRKPALTAHR